MNRKVYAIDKSIKNLKKELSKAPKGLFYRRERKELDEKKRLIKSKCR